MPTPAAVGVSAKPIVVLLEVSVAPIERMPFASDAVADVAAVEVPSTRNVTGLACDVGGVGVVGVGVAGPGVAVGVGETGVETVPLPPPPHATAINAVKQTAAALRQAGNFRPNLEFSGVFIGHRRVAFVPGAMQDCAPY